MTKTILLATLLNLVTISALSQKNLQPGRIVLTDRDTIEGFINYREWSRNPSVIEFTPSKTESTKRYTKNDLLDFEITGKRSYRKYQVAISLDPNRINDIAEKNTESKIEEVFLKLLFEGKNVSLFSYEDEIKLRYYILTNEHTNPEELKNSMYILNGKMVNEKEYLTQLRLLSIKYAPTDAALIRQTNNTPYSSKAILSILYRLNGIASTDRPKKSGINPVRFFAGVGMDKRATSFSGEIRYSGNSSSILSPMAIAGLDLLFNPEVGKFYLHNSISYSGYKTKASARAEYYEATNVYNYELQQSIIAFNSQIAWNLYNQPQFKIFVAGGAGANFSFPQTNKQTYHRYSMGGDTSVHHTEDFLFLSKFWLNFNARVGVEIKNINIGIHYIPKTVISDAQHYSLETSNVQLRAVYFFKKKK